MDCDVLFSCVDRHWPRHLLNYISYCHLVPVVDGGILVRMKSSKFKGADWAAHTSGPSRACLSCTRGYSLELVEMERQGLLDDPAYIRDLDPDSPLRRNENIFPFSMSLASMELLQFIALTTGLLHMPDLGIQYFHYNLGQLSREEGKCKPLCPFPGLVATGDSVISRHELIG